MGCFSNFCGGNSMWWILILLLILDRDDGRCGTCDSLIWILLLSRFCGNDSHDNDNGGSCGCSCQPVRTCGC